MQRLGALLLLLAILLPAQTRDAGPRNLSHGATRPTTCTVGDVFFDTSQSAGQNLYVCASTDTWTQITSGSGGGATAAFSLTDFSLTKTSDTISTLGGSCSSSAPCTYRVGGKVYDLTSPAVGTLSGTSATGTIFWYISPTDGRVKAGHNTAATLSCDTDCDVVTSVSAFPAGTIPLQAHTFTSNVLDAVAASMDHRAFISTFSLLPGTGISLSTSGSTGEVTASVDSTIQTVATDQAGSSRSCGTAGTSTAYTCSLSPAITAYTDRMTMSVTFDEVSGTNPTLNVNSLGAKNIYKSNGTSAPAQIGANELQATTYLLRYDASLNSSNGGFITDTGGGGGGGAPTDATYITQTANGTLSNEQALSSLSTGLVKVTTGTGVLSTASSGTDYVAPAAIRAPFDDTKLHIIHEFENHMTVGTSGYQAEGWQYGGMSTWAPSPTLSHTGTLEGYPTTAANSIAYAFLFREYSFNYGTFRLLDSTVDWEMQWVFKTPDTVTGGSVIRVGLIDSTPNTQTPGKGYWARYNNNSACTTTGSDATWIYEAKDAASSTGTGPSFVANQWFTLSIRSTSAGSIVYRMRTNGGAWSSDVTISEAANTPDEALTPFIHVINCSTSYVYLVLDKWEVYATGLSR